MSILFILSTTVVCLSRYRIGSPPARCRVAVSLNSIDLPSPEITRLDEGIVRFLVLCSSAKCTGLLPARPEFLRFLLLAVFTRFVAR